MGFGNPLILAGLLGLAVPIIIHLLARRTSRPVDFSSVMFLQPILVRVARRHRLKELLVLFLRCAAIAALVFGLSAPVLRPGAGARSHAGTAVAVVLDNSYSMGYEDGVSRFDRARGLLRDLLESLQEGDEAALVLTAGSREPPALRASRARWLADLDGAAIFQGTGSAGAALHRAVDLLRGSALPNRMLVVLSDLDEREWRGLGKEEWASRDLEDMVLLLLDLGGADAGNLVLRDVRVATPQLVAGRTLELQALVENPGKATLESTIALHVGEKVLGERKLRLGGGAKASVRFPYRPDEPGWIRGKLTLSPDALAFDNERFFAMKATKGIPVLLVDGMPSPIRYLDELFFLDLALGAGRDGTGSSLFEASRVTASNLASTDLKRFRAVILANVGEVTPDAASRLETFVEAGGGLLVFTGENVDPESYNERLGKLLPGVLKGRVGPPSDEVFLSFKVLRPDHAVFRALGKEADFSASQLFSVNDVEPVEGASVLASTSWGMPLLLERPAGAGKVLLLATTADADWSNLPLRVAYLPFIHEAVAYLAGRGFAGGALTVGDPGSPERPGIVTRPAAAGATGVPDEEAFAAVNVDSAESCSGRISPEDLRSRLGGRPLTLLSPDGSLARAVEDARTGIPLAAWLAGAALAALVIETFFANLLRRSGAPAASSPPPSRGAHAP